MKKTRKKFISEFKAKMAIEAINERYTLSVLAERFELHRTQIVAWKREFLTNASAAFATSKKEQEESVDVDKL